MALARSPIVLVADDDRDTRELYRACLDTSGYRTAEAGTGSQAIVSAVELVPDVLVTDYVLPDVDGITVAQRLKGDARTARIRIVMVTGYMSPQLERRAAAAAIERLLAKPCLPQAMMREVARALARPALKGIFDLPPLTPPREARRHGLDRRDPIARAQAVTRVRQEFATVPGLALTAEQARRLFELDRAAVERIFRALVTEGFLSCTPEGAFQRPR